MLQRAVEGFAHFRVFVPAVLWLNHRRMNFDRINSFLGLGLKAGELGFVQISVRGVIVFIAALVMIRLGDRRFLSKKTAFDAILGFILASMLARAVNGTAAFWPTLGAGFIVVALHRFMAILSRRWHWIGFLVKGRSDLVISDGEIIERALRKNDLSEHDLLEDLRLNGRIDTPKQVKLAYVERNGEISAVLRSE